MSDPTADTPEPKDDLAIKVAKVIGLFLVFLGMLNSMPSIPGLQPLIGSLTGWEDIPIRRFSYEYLFPFAFVVMMTIVCLKHSQFRHYTQIRASNAKRYFGLFMDIALVSMAFIVAVSYLIEIDKVCMLDQISGVRAALISDSLQREIEFAQMMGLPEPTSVDDPNCVANTGLWIFPIVVLGVATFLGYNIRVWGLPLVGVAILIAGYAALTVMNWYFFGSVQNRYLVTILGGEPRTLLDARTSIETVLTSSAEGLLGRFMDIILTTVFPYIVLGNLFGVSAGGQSLIKLAFLLTRRLRGGPAHAAIVSSSLFGTISGGPVVNVLSTGVLTIPMMIKRGFNKTFAGGVEAAASSGGQIMPPVMGVAAFILATMTAVPYSEVIIAAAVPAAAYFGALFVTVVFQARKQGIQAQGAVTDEMRLSSTDRVNLVMIFAPILLILFLLLTSKDAIGCGPITDFFGAVTIETARGCQVESLPWFFQIVRNSAGDAGSAGWWAAILLMILFFMDKDIRTQPGKLVEALANAGMMISTLYLLFLAVSVIDFSLNLTGLSNYFARDAANYLSHFGDDGVAPSSLFILVALLMTMGMAVLLGMGMPTVPAYLNVALLMGPLLSSLGIATFTAHMFVFYFAVASAITPPVAVAAFAAASITKADPMMTGFAAVRAGIMMFIVPFLFAFYPELLLIEQAQIDPNSASGAYLPGYDGQFHLGPFAWLVFRLLIAIYFIGSVLARFDARKITHLEAGLRLALAVMILTSWPMVYGAGLALGAVLLVWHWRGGSQPAAA